jgi:hypothetical protein
MAVMLAPPTSSDAVKVRLMICAPSRNAYKGMKSREMKPGTIAAAWIVPGV